MRGMMDIGKELQHLMTGAPTPVNKYRYASPLNPRYKAILQHIKNTPNAPVTDLLHFTNDDLDALRVLTQSMVTWDWINFTEDGDDLLLRLSRLGEEILNTNDVPERNTAPQEQPNTGNVEQPTQEQHKSRTPEETDAFVEELFEEEAGSQPIQLEQEAIDAVRMVIEKRATQGITGAELKAKVDRMVPEGKISIRDRKPCGGLQWLRGVMATMLSDGTVVCVPDATQDDDKSTYYIKASAPAQPVALGDGAAKQAPNQDGGTLRKFADGAELYQALLKIIEDAGSTGINKIEYINAIISDILDLRDSPNVIISGKLETYTIDNIQRFIDSWIKSGDIRDDQSNDVSTFFYTRGAAPNPTPPGDTLEADKATVLAIITAAHTNGVNIHDITQQSKLSDQAVTNAITDLYSKEIVGRDINGVNMYFLIKLAPLSQGALELLRKMRAGPCIIDGNNIPFAMELHNRGFITLQKKQLTTASMAMRLAQELGEVWEINADGIAHLDAYPEQAQPADNAAAPDNGTPVDNAATPTEPAADTQQQTQTSVGEPIDPGAPLPAGTRVQRRSGNREIGIVHSIPPPENPSVSAIPEFVRVHFEGTLPTILENVLRSDLTFASEMGPIDGTPEQAVFLVPELTDDLRKTYSIEAAPPSNNTRMYVAPYTSAEKEAKTLRIMIMDSVSAVADELGLKNNNSFWSGMNNRWNKIENKSGGWKSRTVTVAGPDPSQSQALILVPVAEEVYGGGRYSQYMSRGYTAVGVDFDRIPLSWQRYSGGGASEHAMKVRARMIEGAKIIVAAAKKAVEDGSDYDTALAEALSRVSEFSYSDLNKDFESGMKNIFDMVYRDPENMTEAVIIDKININNIPSFKAYMDLFVNERATSVASTVTPLIVINMINTIIGNSVIDWQDSDNKDAAISTIISTITSSLSTDAQIDSDTYNTYIKPVIDDATFIRGYVQSRLLSRGAGVPNNISTNIVNLKSAMTVCMRAIQSGRLMNIANIAQFVTQIDGTQDVDAIVRWLWNTYGIGGTQDAQDHMARAIQIMKDSNRIGGGDYKNVLREYLKTHYSASWESMVTDLDNVRNTMQNDPSWRTTLTGARGAAVDNRKLLLARFNTLPVVSPWEGVDLGFVGMDPDPNRALTPNDLARVTIYYYPVRSEGNAMRGYVFTWKYNLPYTNNVTADGARLLLAGEGTWTCNDGTNTITIAGTNARQRGHAFKQLLFPHTRNNTPRRRTTAQQKLSKSDFVDRILGTNLGKQIDAGTPESIDSADRRFRWHLNAQIGLTEGWEDKGQWHDLLTRAIEQTPYYDSIRKQGRQRSAKDLANEIIQQMDNPVTQGINDLMQPQVRESKSKSKDWARTLLRRATGVGTGPAENHMGKVSDSGYADPRSNSSFVDGPSFQGQGAHRSQMSLASMRQADAAAGPHTDSSMGMVVPTQMNRSIPTESPKAKLTTKRPGTAGIPNSSKKIREKAKEQVEEADEKVDTWRVDPNVVDKMREKVQKGLNKPETKEQPVPAKSKNTTEQARRLLKRLPNKPKRQAKPDQPTINKLEPMSGVPTGYESGIRNNTDKQMGRWQNSGGGVRGLGWDVTGPSVSGTDGKFGP